MAQYWGRGGVLYLFTSTTYGCFLLKSNVNLEVRKSILVGNHEYKMLIYFCTKITSLVKKKQGEYIHIA